MPTVYLGLGSNMGDRRDNLDRALGFLSQRLRVDEVSSVYETKPEGNVEQPMFLNMVCRIDTRLAPTELLTLAKGIERKLGRTANKRNAPALLILISSFMATDLSIPLSWLSLTPGLRREPLFSFHWLRSLLTSSTRQLARRLQSYDKA